MTATAVRMKDDRVAQTSRRNQHDAIQAALEDTGGVIAAASKLPGTDAHTLEQNSGSRIERALLCVLLRYRNLEKLASISKKA